MIKRALFTFDWCKLTDKRLASIKQHSKIYDELIFLVDRADEIMFCGELLSHLNALFSHHLNKPFYLLPVSGKGVTNLYNWIRWRILCPAFDHVYTDKSSLQPFMQSVLCAPVEFLEEDKTASLLSVDKPSRKSRGLFVMRAQPFHLGHAAILEKMSMELEEIIVVIAMANLSHTADNIATAGERLEMVLPFLNKIAPQRHYLAVMPYSDFSLENFYELTHLLPSFEYAYSNNPKLSVLAQTAGYATKTVPIKNGISGSLIRETIIKDLPFKKYVPETVYTFLNQSNITERLKKLNEKEMR